MLLLPFLEQRKHLFGVAGGRNLGKDVQQGLVRANDESRPLDAPDFLAVHILFLEHAKLIADFLVYISKERVGQLVFGAEFGLILGRVAADAEHDDAFGLKFFECIAEAAGFDGAAGRVRSGIKEEYDRPAGIAGEAYGFVLVGLQGKVGNFLVQFHREAPRMSIGEPLAAIRFDYFRYWRQMAAALLLAALPVCAQYPGQVAKSSKDAPVLRSIAVLEWTGEAGKPKACRLVPVAVLDGTRLAGDQLQDGGIYLARPEPLALAGEVEYELQQDGKPVGLFDLRNTGHEQGSWVGYGAWRQPPAPQPKPSMDEVARTKIDDEESDQPVLHRKHHADETPAAPATDGGSSTGSSSPTAATPAASDPDQPTLHRKQGSSDAPAASAPAASTPAPGSGTAPDSDQPTLHRRDASDSESGSAPPKSSEPAETKKSKKKNRDDLSHVDSLPDVIDPDRPRLKRGKPAGSGMDALPSLMGLPAEMRQAVAVSDAKSRPDHPWSFSWANPDDEARMKSALEETARDALGLNPPPAQPPPTPRRSSAHKKLTLPPPPPPAPLLDEDFRVFELAYGSGATLVLTARADALPQPGPAQPGSAPEFAPEVSATPRPAPQKWVTLIAQPDLYGNALVLLKNVADSADLDDNPRMILIDAVDALADNRGELLFELRGQTQRQFALYRVLRGQAQQLIATGNAEIDSR